MNIISDIRFAFRLLLKNPGSSAVAILAMAVGTGVAITMFAFLNGVLWSPLELKEERELVVIQWSNPDAGRRVRWPDIKAFRDEARSFEKMVGFNLGTPSPFYNPSGDAPAKDVRNARVQADFFDILGEKPFLGRDFLPTDSAIISGPRTAIISYSLWQEQFGGDESAVGSVATMAGWPCTIVGVMPPGFRFPSDTDLWHLQDWDLQGRDRSRPGGTALGILKDGVSRGKAKAEIDTIAQRLALEYPETNENLTSVDIVPYTRWFVGDTFTRSLYILLFCSLLVLGVACANVFNLVMVRIATRTSELSIRSAMGARRIHIIIQVLFDGLLLSGLGALGGILIAGWSLKVVELMVGRFWRVPYWWNLELDASVFGFVVAIVIASALLSSLVPGLRASRSSVAENLKDDSRTSSGLFIGALSKVILSFQITVTGVLVFVSVLLSLVWIDLKGRPMPYDPDKINSVIISLNNSRREGDEATTKMTATQNLLRERLLADSGVDAVAMSNDGNGGAVPVGYPFGSYITPVLEVEGVVYETEEEKPQASAVAISEGFESVFRIEPLIGRGMSLYDTLETEPVCMVNKALVDHLWPNENPIGKRIKLFEWRFSSEYRTIVGVMPNLLPSPLPGENLLELGYYKVFLPYSQTTGLPQQGVLMRGRGDARQFHELVQKELARIDPDRAIRRSGRSLREVYGDTLVLKEIIFTMFGVFGVASLVLGIAGLYSVMSFSTRQRFREFGIRMALGADTKGIMFTAAKRGIVLLAMGGLLGLGIGHFVSGHLRSAINVYQLPLGLTYPIVVGILLLASALSIGLPAWRAARLEPSKALSEE